MQRMDADVWIFLSYVVTVVGFPMAIAVFLYEKRKERANQEVEVFELLSASYQDFLKIALENPDLRLLSKARTEHLTDEQQERMRAIFGLLMALFERAYLLLYDRRLKGKQAQRWRSWEDFMQEWCERDDFREALPELLRGEDPEFAGHISKLADIALPP